MKDALLISTLAYPAAGANGDCTSFDLGARTSPRGVFPGAPCLEIAYPLTTTLVDGKIITFTVQDSADNTTFVTTKQTATVTGATGNGNAAGTVRVRLAPSVRRYVNVNASVPADAGNNTAKSFTVSLVFGES